MWRIIQSEIDYNKYLILGFLGCLPLICAVSRLSIEVLQPNFWLFLIMYMMMMYWNLYKNKEKRDYQHAKLPIPLSSLALFRILLIFLSCLSFVGFYAILYLIIRPAEYLPYMKWIISIEILLFGFSTYFIMRDLFWDFFRRIGFTKNTVIVGFALIVLGLNLLGIFAFLKTDANGNPPEIIKHIITFIEIHHPFTSERGILVILVISIILAGLSVFTYTRRKSYLE